jgi:hypothetical protein
VVCDERETAQDERPHDDLAQFRISRDKGAQPLGAQLKKLTTFGDASEHEVSLSGNTGKFSCKRTGTVCGYQALTCEVRLHDLHASGKHDKERNLGVARTEQDLARFNSSKLAPRTDPIDLCRRQIREHLCASIERAMYGPGRHSFLQETNRIEKL